MSSLIPQSRRPGTNTTLGNHEQRIRRLEAILSRLGWRFDTDNEGGWGYVITNDSIDIDFGILGMVLGDRSTQGMFIFSQDQGSGEIGSVLLTPDAITVALSATIAVTIDRAAGTITVTDITGVPAKMMEMTAGSADLHLPTGGNVIFDL